MRRFLILSVLSVVNILIAFAYHWYVITRLGPGRETDALFAGMVIPQLVLAVVSSSLTHVLVPVLSSSDSEQFRRDAWTFFQSVGGIFSILALAFGITANIWVPWIVPGFDSDTLSLVVQLTRIQLVGMVFAALTAVLWAAQHARMKFYWVELCASLANLIGFGFLFWGLPVYGVKAAAWAMVIKGFFQAAFLVRGLGAYCVPDWCSDSSKEVLRRLRPLLLGTTYYKTGILVDRFLASMAPAGDLTLLNLTQQLYSAGSTILNKSIVTPAVPVMSRKAVNLDWSEFRSFYRNRLLIITVISVTFLLLILIAGKTLLSLLFAYSQFSVEHIFSLRKLMLALGGYWVAGVMGLILSSAFYARGDTKTPTMIGILGFSAGIVLKVIGFYWAGVLGLAIGTTVYYIANAILLTVCLECSLHKQK